MECSPTCWPGASARPAWVGLGVCVAVAAVMQVLYVTVGHNQSIYRTGGLFGLGTLWFEGALVADLREGVGQDRLGPEAGPVLARGPGVS